MRELHVHMHFNEGPITRELPAVDPEMPAHAKPKTYTVESIHNAMLFVLAQAGMDFDACHSLTNEVLEALEELK